MSEETLLRKIDILADELAHYKEKVKSGKMTLGEHKIEIKALKQSFKGVIDEVNKDDNPEELAILKKWYSYLMSKEAYINNNLGFYKALARKK